MSSKIERYLSLVGDLLEFAPSEKMGNKGDELLEDELELITAAGKKPDYASFLRNIQKQRKE